MKRIGLFFLFLSCHVITSCGTQYRVIEKESQSIVFDFRKYTNRGFMFTPEKYTKEYESIGLIDLVIYTKMVQAQKTIGEKPVLNLGWTPIPINPNELIEMAYREATSMGANAITGFQIKNTSRFNPIHKIDVPGVRLVGFAIKRKIR